MVHMKEAAVHIDNLSVSREHNIRLTWKIALVKPVAITQAVNNGSNESLRTRIPTPDPRHIEASLLRS
jgi:hypothetical protein